MSNTTNPTGSAAPKPGPPKARSGKPGPQAAAPATTPTPATPAASEPTAGKPPRRQPAAKLTVNHPTLGRISGTAAEVTALLAAASSGPTNAAAPVAVPAPSASTPSTPPGPQDTLPLTQADVDKRVAEALEHAKKERKPWYSRALIFTSATIASLAINMVLVGVIVGLFALSYSGILGHPIGWPTIILAIVIWAAVKGWNRSTRNKTRHDVLEELKKSHDKKTEE